MEFNTEGILKSRAVGGVAVLSFERGRIREEREILLTLESLGRFVSGKKGLKILLDLGQVEYLSSAGLGHLVALLKKCRSGGGVLKLCGLQDPIRELFSVMCLDRIFEIYPTVEEALESFKTAEKEGEKTPAG